MKKKALLIIMVTITAMVLYNNTLTTNQLGWPMYDYCLQNAVAETSSVNIVTAIYLNYRYYDTLFEALMLLFSIIAIIHMSVHEGGNTYE